MLTHLQISVIMKDMSVQDAQDIVQMNSLSGEVPIAAGGKKKSSLLWIVLGCVVVGVGLGVYVYQQSLSPAPKPTPTPKATVKPPTPSVAPVVPEPTQPSTNQVTPAANTMTFPKKGKLRIYHDLNNIQMVIQIVINGSTKTITLPNKSVSTSTLMNFADSSFEVEAGSVGTVKAFLNSTSGPQLRGWVEANDKKKCGSNGGSVLNWENKLDFITPKLAGESIFAYQCWEDDDTPGEFNDLYMVWTYAPATSTVSPSPASSTSPSPSASVKASASPSPSGSKSPSPSPSVKASTAATVASPSPSVRAAMPDTSEGVPVTGVFEVTVGTVSVGIVLLLLGLLGLLTL